MTKGILAPMSALSVEEAIEKIRAGLHINCGCGAKLAAGTEEPEGDAVEFVRLWFEDHSYEDFSRHGLIVVERLFDMRKSKK